MDAYLPPFWPTVVLLALLVSAAGVGWIARDRFARHHWLTDRFLYGIPWGSMIALSLVVVVYLFVQDGITEFSNPVYLPFVNWSYLYPTGVVFAPFAHGSAGHLIGNLTTAAVLAPIAEYIWSHYPNTATNRLRDRPVVRATVLFPGAIVAVGLFTSLFTWGPVIGFSGVVYALAGFTVVRFPIITVVALMVRSAVREFGSTLFDPVVEATTGVALTTPSWVGVSFQGHAIGFLAGAIVGIVILHQRDRSVDPIKLWIALLLVMIGMGLWSIWGTRSEDVYVLYRGLGFALLFVAALLLTVAAVARDRSLLGRLTRQQTAVLVVVLPLLVLIGIAIPLNMLTVAEHDPPADRLSVEGYDIFYDPDSQNQLRSVLDPSDTGGNASGVILVNEDRQVWMEGISSTDLAFAGEGSIVVGDIRTRTEVTANRTGWSPIGNDSVYRVALEHENESVPAYASDTQVIDQEIAGYQLAIEASIDDGFFVTTHAAQDEQARAAIPAHNESVEVGEITLEREEGVLFVTIDDTRVRIATSENGG